MAVTEGVEIAIIFVFRTQVILIQNGNRTFFKRIRDYLQLLHTNY